MTHIIDGVNVAAATPIGADGRPDGARFAAHCRTLLANGCHGIAMLGSTGEANSISIGDRMDLIDAVRAAGIPGEALLPGTSAPALVDAVALTRHAVGAGAKGCLVLPPYYYKGVSDEGLFRFYAGLIEGVADDRLRVILYHIPQISAVPISHDLIGRLMEAFPGIVVAIKDSSGDFDNMVAMVRRFPDLAVITGSDPLFLPLLREGGAGCITGAANLCPPALRTVWDAWRDPARAAEVDAAQAEIVAWRKLTTRYDPFASFKQLLAHRYGDPSWAAMMPPLVELSAAARDEICDAMDALEKSPVSAG